MDATPRKMISLISDAYTRFVVPVYQRPYSWDIKQCVQLWDDIVSCGRNKTRAHFTGSIVSIQDGSVSSQGVATLLLIDGQQRTATMTLLLIALARYAATHPQERLEFSREEILASGYLTNQFRTGNDHYKLTLSKGDDPTLRSLINNLEDPSAPIVDDSPRLLENLDFFQNRINAIADVNVVWEGVRRIEVVSIAELHRQGPCTRGPHPQLRAHELPHGNPGGDLPHILAPHGDHAPGHHLRPALRRLHPCLPGR